MNTKRAVQLRRRWIKRRMRALRWRCFWTWPFGHDDSLNVCGINVCRFCYRPTIYLGRTGAQKLELWETAMHQAEGDGLLPKGTTDEYEQATGAA